MRKDKLLRTLVSTAIGIIVFCGAVFAILTFTGDNKSGTKNTTTTNSSSSTNKSSKQTTSSSSSDNKVSSSTNSNTTTNSNSSSTTNSSASTPSSSTTSSATSSTTNKPAVTTNNNTNTNTATNTTNTTNNTATTNISGSVFKTQAEAHEYGKKTIETRAKQINGTAAYSISSVRDSKGNVTGWAVNITESKANTANTNTATTKPTNP